MTPAAVFGSLAGSVGVLGAIPYVRDVLRRATRPHRGTWVIWTLLSIVALFSQRAGGATWSIVMVVAEACSTSLICLLSVRRGEGGLSPSDLAIAAIAIVGLAAWAFTSAPVLATALVVCADSLAVGLMLPKTWRDPASETLALYVLAGVSGVLSALAVGALDISLLLFPVYFALVNAFLATVIGVRRRRVKIVAVSVAASRSGWCPTESRPVSSGEAYGRVAPYLARLGACEIAGHPCRELMPRSVRIGETGRRAAGD